MIELYSLKDVCRIFEQKESRLRYWVQSGFLWPSVRKKGKFFYTFEDLIQIRTALELLANKVPMKSIRMALKHLRENMPEELLRNRSRVYSDGRSVVIDDGSCRFEPFSGQTVIDFDLVSLEDRIAEVVELFPRQGSSDLDQEAVPNLVEVEATLPDGFMSSGYRLFKMGLESEESENTEKAEELYRQAIDDEPTLAAAYTNLGNLMYEKGKIEDAKHCYSQAVKFDPEQVEAKYNLANLHNDEGDDERALTHLRRIVERHPGFVDAHFNLGVFLENIGGHAQAKIHFEKYLEFDSDSPWAEQAKEVIGQ